MKIRYQYSNHLGSASLELNDAGEFVSYQEYFPFGETAYTLGEVSTEYRFTGKERDEFTGLYYFGARYYAPWMFRWMNPDPSGPVDGLNVFVYCTNRPIVMVDPDGRSVIVAGEWIDGINNSGLKEFGGLATLAALLAIAAVQAYIWTLDVAAEYDRVSIEIDNKKRELERLRNRRKQLEDAIARRLAERVAQAKPQVKPTTIDITTDITLSPDIDLDKVEIKPTGPTGPKISPVGPTVVPNSKEGTPELKEKKEIENSKPIPQTKPTTVAPKSGDYTQSKPEVKPFPDPKDDPVDTPDDDGDDEDAIVNFYKDGRLYHFSVEVGEYHVHQSFMLLDRGEETTTMAIWEENPRYQYLGSIKVPLPNPEGSKTYIQSQLNTDRGPYNLTWNSCLTTVTDVLEHGGNKISDNKIKKEFKNLLKGK